MSGTPRKAFKDYFDRAATAALGAQMARAWRGFPKESFMAHATRGLAGLEMMARVKQISGALRDALPAHTPRALRVLVKSLPPPLPDCESVMDGYLQWPVGQLIADHGVGHFDESMEAMIELTQRFTAEFAVRPFVEQQPKQVLARFLELTGHPNPHVRRWCSEGIRPRLPWGRKLPALIADPRPILPVLHALRDDPELYVRRSVANNLNDIAKDHPDLVVDVASRWARGASPTRKALLEHALRTLVKSGHPRALDVLGVGSPNELSAALTVRPRRLPIGERAALELTIENRAASSTALLVDYAIDFATKTGKTSRKVFKWDRFEFGASEARRLAKHHTFRHVTTRTLYPGPHRLVALVNGRELTEATVVLEAPGG